MPSAVSSTAPSASIPSAESSFPNYTSRAEVPSQYKWDLTTLYPNVEAWNEGLAQLKQDLRLLDRYKDQKLTAQTLCEVITLSETLSQQYARLGMYAYLLLDCDTKDTVANKLSGKISSFDSAFAEATSFIEPKILELSWPEVEGMLSTLPELAIYRFDLSELFRKKATVCEAKIEAVIGAASAVMSGPEQTYAALLDTSLKVPDLVHGGKSYPVSVGNYEDGLSNPDPQVRKAAFRAVFSTLTQFGDTFTSLYATHLEGAIFDAKQRGFKKIADYYLFDSAIPQTISDATTLGCQQFAPAWKTHFELRRQALGQEQTKFWDVFAPLSKDSPKIPYDQAVEMVLESLAPLGAEYVSVLRAGLTQKNWVDVYPTPNKRSNAYSYGGYNVPPVIMLNYFGLTTDVSTLAHEAGHSMHTYLSSKEQPYVYHEYSLFNTEIASTVNQILFSRHFLETATDRDQKLDVIASAVYPLHRYLLQMPLLSEVEKFAHDAIETGSGLTAEAMSKKTVQMMQKYYDGAVDLSGADRKLLGALWIGFGHLYSPTYVRMYSCGILAACQIAQQIIDGEPGVLERYQTFLKSGSSKPSLELLKDLGVDFETSKPFDAAHKLFGFLNCQLAELV